MFIELKKVLKHDLRFGVFVHFNQVFWSEYQGESGQPLR